MGTARGTDAHSRDPGYPAERFWDEHWRTHRRTGAERPNPLLVETAEHLSPGTAMDISAAAVEGVRLDPARWPVLRAGKPRRQAIGPAGGTATVTGHVLVLRRATG